MANYAAPGNNPNNGFMVMTQAAPEQNMVPFGGSTSNLFWKFLKENMSVLGTIQIMIGLFSLLMAFVLTVGIITFSTYSGVTYLCSVSYIISGSLTMAVGKRPTPCLVRGALGMNAWSAVVAGTAIIFFSLDFHLGNEPCDYSSKTCEYYYQFLAKVFGISGVLLVLSVLQLIISICISALGCRTTCYSNPEVSVMTVAQNYPMTNPFGGLQPFQTHGGQQPYQTHGGQQPYQTHGGQQPYQTHGGQQPYQTHGGQQGPFHTPNYNAGSPLGYGHGFVTSAKNPPLTSHLSHNPPHNGASPTNHIPFLYRSPAPEF